MAENQQPGINLIRIILTFTGIGMIAAGLILYFLKSEGNETMMILSIALVLVGFVDLVLSWFIFRKS